MKYFLEKLMRAGVVQGVVMTPPEKVRCDCPGCKLLRAGFYPMPPAMDLGPVVAFPQPMPSALQ